MARREVERQMRLFGVGDLGPPDDDDGDAGSGVSDDERWQGVHSRLWTILAEEGFLDYLARRRRGQDRSGDER